MISVLTPVYNRKEDLRDLLDAFATEFAQAPYFEVLVIDDKSNDGTFEIAVEFSNRNSFCTVLTSGYRSPGISRNIGAKAAKFDWLIYCDSDNRMTPGWVNRIMPYLNQYSTCDGIWFPAMSDHTVLTSSKYTRRGTHMITPFFYFNHYIGEVVHCIKRRFLVDHSYYYMAGYTNDFPDALWFQLFSSSKYKVLFCNIIIQEYFTRAGNRISTELSMNKIESQVVHYSIVFKMMIRTRYVFTKYFLKITVKLIGFTFCLDKNGYNSIKERIGSLGLLSKLSRILGLNIICYRFLTSQRSKK